MRLYYTHFLVEYPSNIDIKFDEKNFEKIDINISEFSETMRFISLKTDMLDEEAFEKKRNDFILFLSKMNLYVSILFDSISADRHKTISDSIYNLEREFRNLIEIVFLDNVKKGNTLNDVAAYERIAKKDKKTNRNSVVQALENPLDDLDFIQLKEFVTENMAMDSNRTIITKLDLLFDKFEAKAETGLDNQKIIEDIYSDIKELKSKILSKNEKSLSASNLYNHLTVSISDEWAKLYKIRNLWAHNNCIITKSEFEEYIKLSEIVLNKIDVEFTLMTFFNDNTNESVTVIFESEDNRKRLSIKKYEIHGRENCKVEFIIYENDNSAILEQNNFTYKELNKWFEILDLQQLKIYNLNPLLLFGCSTIRNVFDNKLNNISIEKLEEIYKNIKGNDIDIRFTRQEGDACSVAKEIEEHLAIIFKK